MSIVLDGTTGISTPAQSVAGNLSYTGTLTGNGGIVNIGSGQIYKDASGNVGIGTSSPSSRLSVSGANSGVAADINYSSGVALGTEYSALRFTASALGFVGAEIRGINTNGGTNVGVMAFHTSGTEKMRLDSSGNLLVGTTTNNYGSKVVANGGFTSTGTAQFNIAGTAATNFEWVLRSGAGMQFYVNNASVIATLTSSGVWTNASDARYKENIQTLSYGLAEVMQLQPRSYNIIGSQKQEIGFVAQEVEPLIPELVESTRNSVTEEDRLTLSYGQLSAVLVKAIQEQQALITTLTERITALEAK
jgi:hypothetical protein